MLREELERDRLEMAAELAHRGPTQASKARASAGLVEPERVSPRF